MKRTFFINDEILLGQYEMVMSIRQGEVAGLALEVALLLEDLSRSLRIRSDESPKGASLVLSVGGSKDQGPKRKRVAETSVATCRSADNTMYFSLREDEVGALYVTLLQAYRDQIAEVNHIHLSSQKDGQEFDLTVVFEQSREFTERG